MAKCEECGLGIPRHLERCEECETDVSDIERAKRLIKRATVRAIYCLREARMPGASPVERATLLDTAKRARELCQRERRFIALSREAIATRRFENDDTTWAPYSAVAVTLGCAS